MIHNTHQVSEVIKVGRSNQEKGGKFGSSTALKGNAKGSGRRQARRSLSKHKMKRKEALKCNNNKLQSDMLLPKVIKGHNISGTSVSKVQSQHQLNRNENHSGINESGITGKTLIIDCCPDCNSFRNISFFCVSIFIRLSSVLSSFAWPHLGSYEWISIP